MYVCISRYILRLRISRKHSNGTIKVKLLKKSVKVPSTMWFSSIFLPTECTSQNWHVFVSILFVNILYIFVTKHRKLVNMRSSINEILLDSLVLSYHYSLFDNEVCMPSSYILMFLYNSTLLCASMVMNVS